MSRQLSLYRYLPKRRHIEEEEEKEYERETTSDSVEEVTEEVTEEVAEHATDHRIQPIEPTHDIGSVDDIASTPECSPCQPASIQFPTTYFSGKT